MYQPFHKLRVRFAELEMKQGEVAKRANMAESTLTARMTGRLPWNGDEIARVAKVLDIPPVKNFGLLWMLQRSGMLSSSSTPACLQEIIHTRSCARSPSVTPWQRLKHW